jgi:hypothetical protein
MPSSSSAKESVTLAEQLRTLAAELDRQGRAEFAAGLFERGRSEGLKALHATANDFLQRVDRARDTLRATKDGALAAYRAPILKVLKAVEAAADVTFARQRAGAPKDDGEWLLAQRLNLLPEHYRTLSADHGKTLNDLASEVETAFTKPSPARPVRPRTSRERRR